MTFPINRYFNVGSLSLVFPCAFLLLLCLFIAIISLWPGICSYYVSPLYRTLPSFKRLMAWSYHQAVPVSCTLTWQWPSQTCCSGWEWNGAGGEASNIECCASAPVEWAQGWLLGATNDGYPAKWQVGIPKGGRRQGVGKTGCREGGHLKCFSCFISFPK